MSSQKKGILFGSYDSYLILYCIFKSEAANTDCCKNTRFFKALMPFIKREFYNFVIFMSVNHWILS